MRLRAKGNGDTETRRHGDTETPRSLAPSLPRSMLIAEAAILVIFLITALAVILGRSATISTDVERTASSFDVDDGRSAKKYVRLGDRAYAAGRTKFNEASIRYWEALKQEPDMAEAHFKLATIYYEYIWNDETLRELSELERIDPEHPGLYSLLGKTYNRMGDIDKASESLRRAVTLQPGNSEAHYYLGAICQQKNMVEEAISEYEKAVEASLKPALTDSASVLKAYLQLGRIYKVRKEQEKAKDRLRKALSIDSASAEVISELKSLYKKEAEDYEYRDEHNKAAEKYEEMLRMDPDDPQNVEFYLKLGSIYRTNELYDKAAAMYEAATELDPLNFDAYSALKELELLRDTDSGKR